MSISIIRASQRRRRILPKSASIFCNASSKSSGSSVVELFIVDVELYLNLSRAGKTDDLGDTIDYVQVLRDIKKIVGGTPRNLIETVAQDICEILLRKYFLLEGLKIVLHKPAPPVEEKFAGAAVQIVRHR